MSSLDGEAEMDVDFFKTNGNAPGQLPARPLPPVRNFLPAALPRLPGQRTALRQTGWGSRNRGVVPVFDSSGRGSASLASSPARRGTSSLGPGPRVMASGGGPGLRCSLLPRLPRPPWQHTLAPSV